MKATSSSDHSIHIVIFLPSFIDSERAGDSLMRSDISRDTNQGVFDRDPSRKSLNDPKDCAEKPDQSIELACPVEVIDIIDWIQADDPTQRISLHLAFSAAILSV